MSVLADVKPGPPCGEEELRAALLAQGVTFMVDAEPLHRLAEQLSHESFSGAGLLVARGQAPSPGLDGYFEPAFPIGIQAGHLDENGTMNLYDRELLKSLGQGEYIGQLHQPVGGTQGRTVDGRAIAVAPVCPSKLRPGPGISMSADGRMHAARAGVLMYSYEQTIDISQHYVHQGNVDLRSGNLQMEGSIVVQGSVQRKFSVRASGNVDIQGEVDSGTVLAAGAVRVSGRVWGGDSGLICAEGDASLQHAEAARVRCGGLLKLESAFNSELQANKIQILRAIRGGSAQAEHSVCVTEAGTSRAATSTSLAAGVPLERPLSDVRVVLDAAKNMRNVQRHAGVRGADERAKGGKLGRAAATLEQQALARKAELAARRQQLLPKAYVEVLGMAHAGISVQIGVHSIQVQESVARVRFVYDAERNKIRTERPV